MGGSVVIWLLTVLKLSENLEAGLHLGSLSQYMVYTEWDTALQFSALVNRMMPKLLIMAATLLT